MNRLFETLVNSKLHVNRTAFKQHRIIRKKFRIFLKLLKSKIKFKFLFYYFAKQYNSVLQSQGQLKTGIFL